MPITSLTSYFNTSSFGDANASTRNQQELALTLDSAAQELSNWKSLISMSAGGGAYELGRLAAATFVSSVPVLCAVPFLTQALTFFSGALADTGLTGILDQAFGNAEEGESFWVRMMDQSSVRGMGLLGAGQSFVVIQLMQGLASAGRGMLGGENSKKEQGGMLASILQGLRCHFGSGMFAGLTGGVVSAVEKRMEIKSKHMHVKTGLDLTLQNLGRKVFNSEPRRLAYAEGSASLHETPGFIHLAKRHDGGKKGGPRGPQRTGQTISLDEGRVEKKIKQLRDLLINTPISRDLASKLKLADSHSETGGSLHKKTSAVPLDDNSLKQVREVLELISDVYQRSLVEITAAETLKMLNDLETCLKTGKGLEALHQKIEGTVYTKLMVGHLSRFLENPALATRSDIDSLVEVSQNSFEANLDLARFVGILTLISQSHPDSVLRNYASSQLEPLRDLLAKQILEVTLAPEATPDTWLSRIEEAGHRDNLTLISELTLRFYASDPSPGEVERLLENRIPLVRNMALMRVLETSENRGEIWAQRRERIERDCNSDNLPIMEAGIDDLVVFVTYEIKPAMALLAKFTTDFDYPERQERAADYASDLEKTGLSLGKSPS